MSLAHGITSTGAVVPLLVSTAGALNLSSAALDSVSDLNEKAIWTAAATMVNGTTIFTIAGGPIYILQIGSLCITANNATASTLQYSADGTDGAATTITGASASLASLTAGNMVAAVPGTLATAPAIYTNGVGIGATVPILVPAGIITIVVGVGSTTGTWRHFMRYKPLTTGVTVT